MRTSQFFLSTLVPLSLLVSCATSVAPEQIGADNGGPVFVQGDDSEMLLAEELAYAELLPGIALEKQVGELRTLRVRLDELNFAHVKVQQTLNGVPVFGGEAIVHLYDDGSLFAITDDLIPNVQVDTVPAFDAAEAMSLAADSYYLGWGELTQDPIVDLQILRHEGVDHLVYRVQLSRLQGDAQDAMPVMFIDAHTGDLVWSYNNFQTATCTGATNYYGTVSVDCYTDGTSYFLEDQTENLGTFTWNNTTSSLYYASSTSSTFSGTAVTKNAVEAHYVMQAVYNYFSSAHGRTGIDGAGGPAYITTHGDSYITATTSYSRSYVNAYWDPTNKYMVYGDGDGSTSNSLTSLDVGGHETAHGVTQFEANLTYSGEPGHLNEATSDIFGAMVERSVLGESADTWLIGEDPWTPGTSGDALRYMNDPADDGYSYDYYSSSIGSVDVHYGSGVPNLVFYLMSEGGTHPRGKSTVSVTAIGADDAADIWYLALKDYMTSSTSFSGARTAMLSAATSLYGSTSNQYKAVQDAWAAVGVGSSSSGGGSSSCTTTTYTGSLSKSRASAYAPSSSGTSVTSTTQTAALTGPSSADFDLYLQKKSGSTWSTVASSAVSGSTESLSYSGTSGTYRVRVYSYSGSGSFSLAWCK